MKLSTLEILCCPLCKRELELQIEARDNLNVTEGSLTCNGCKNEYLIRNGIPRMYIPDNKVTALSNNSNFPKFIITPENLYECIKKNRTRTHSNLLTSKVITRILLLSGWVFFLSGILVLILSSLNIGITNKIPLLALYLLIGIPVIFFVIDYLRYRLRASIEYSANVIKLKQLTDNGKSGEYHLHISTQDREDTSTNVFQSTRNFAARKGEKIASILDNRNFMVKNVLNVGCGGPLTMSASEPYFDRGYDVVGLDVGEEYLIHYNKMFSADVVQANGIALTFMNNNFDLVNFTDILEHLHDPFLGLKEAQRVLRSNGIIILTTPNRSVFYPTQINPLILVEKIIGLYYDRILPPRSILAQWMGIDFYHTEFSKKEVTRLVESAGFEIVRLETESFHREKLNMIWKKLPFLKFMCYEFMIVGKKTNNIA